jgi:hypothetical protein
MRRPGVLAPIAWGALLYCLLSAAAAWGQESQLETAVKATYLVKFAAFVEWPANAFETTSSPLSLCIVGAPFGGLADEAARGQVVGQHPLVVRHVAAATHPSGCHILFTAGSAQQSVDAALAAVGHDPVLSVTDLPQTAAHKGIINFELQNNHVRFAIDDREAVQSGLRISSQLLALAVNVGSH